MNSLGPISIIPFPRKCTDGLASYWYTINCYDSALKSSGKVVIECAGVEFFEPMGLTLLASIAYDLVRRPGREVWFAEPTNAGVLKYLHSQDFFKEFVTEGSGSTRISFSTRSSSIGLKRMECFDGGYLDQIPQWLMRNSHLPQEAILDVINTTVPEIINNVFDHSRSMIGCYICAQAYPKTKHLMLSTMDLGVGFLDSLRGRFPSLEHNADAIELAVQPRITSKSRPHNAGAGLDVLSGFLKKYGGTLEILSRDGRWKQNQDGTAVKDRLPFQFPGTCINLVFDDQKVMDRFTMGDRYD